MAEIAKQHQRFYVQGSRVQRLQPVDTAPNINQNLAYLTCSTLAELLYRRVGIAHQKYQIQLLTVGNAHPTGILLESTNSKFQIHRRISSHACTYAVGETKI